MGAVLIISKKSPFTLYQKDIKKSEDIMYSYTSAREAQGWRVVLLVYGLYILGFFTSGLSTVAGLVIAYMKEGRVATRDINEHLKSLINTFWAGLALVVVGTVLTVVGIGFLILLGTTIWYIYVVGTGTIAALNHEPV